MGAGDARGAFSLYAEDVHYRLIGSTPISNEATGLREVVKTITGPFVAKLRDQKIDLILDETIAEGANVVALAHSRAVAETGLPYENEYAMVFRMNDAGQIASITEFLDTALVETAVFGRTIVEG